jgi:mono/diheme cytochrome c family protein
MTTRSLRFLTAVSFAIATATFAQTPGGAPAGGPPPGGQQRRSMPPPSNLKVLPKDMTSQQVVAIMHQWEEELGVGCSTCHAKDPATGRNNFASDANPMKDRARVMMKMTASINAEYLTQLTDPKPTQAVTCGTCHQGNLKPVPFVPPPSPPRPGGPPAAAPPPPPTR